MTVGFDVFVQLVMAAMATDPVLTCASCPFARTMTDG